jgi:enediyne biosynthesis protein E4
MALLNYWTRIIFVLVIVSACKSSSKKLFTKLDENETGVNFKNVIQENANLNIFKYTYFYNGGGVAIGDINNDGLQDIYFTGNMVKDRLFLNKGDFKFEDISLKSGIAEQGAKPGWCTGVTMIDINNDNKLDIYVCRSADPNPENRKNLLFVNNGNLTFTEKAESFGLADPGFSTQASFFDYDKDGDLDMFLINHSLQKYTTGSQENPELRKEKNPFFADKLYRNDSLHFTDVTEQAGISSNVLSFGLGLSVSDINNDGWPDIYVSNDFNEPDYLFTNNKNGTFKENLKDCMDQVSQFSMGCDIADYNNDGFTDVVTLDMLAEDNKTQKMHSGAENFDKTQMLIKQGSYYQFSRNMLHKNNGDGTFSETGQLAGISNTDWSWSALFTDFDNDGNKDLFVTNGYVKDYLDLDFLNYLMSENLKAKEGNKEFLLADYISKMSGNETPNYVFKNKGDGSFLKSTDEWGLNQKTVSSGSVYADLDNDGDMDLVVNNINEYAGVFKNNSRDLLKNNYIKIALAGTEKNKSGIGAKVKIFCKDSVFYQEQFPVRGFQSSIDPVLNFGIGSNSFIDSILIIWPDDRMQVVRQINTNRQLTLKITDAREKFIYNAPSYVQKYFTQDSVINAFHRENDYNDFTVQPLLPAYLSRQGPCMAKADINNDGLEDIFIGGSKNYAGQIFIQSKDGYFNITSQKSIVKDSLSEDVAAEFFDADNDGDKDLYVAGGGYEFSDQDSLLQDRLYINDGRGNFIRKDNSLPKFLFSKGCVKAADADNDGDLDLFIGGRLIPGKYPMTPESKLLFNDGKGNFSDVTAINAPNFKSTGMVTDAVWMDLNNDKQQDLIIVGEWMQIKVFINHKGKFSDVSSSFIKFPSSGWWSRIYADDFDGDGDKDLVVGNWGLNEQFHATDKEPLSMYYKDFDENGTIDPIFCYYINNVSYPAASKDDITQQLPSLKKKFLYYHNYANAGIDSIFSKEMLKNAGLLNVQELSTIYLENRGIEGFSMKYLPFEAQYSPVYGIASLDVNGDKNLDIVLAGNNSWVRTKFGRFAANHGTLLLGDGKGNFSYTGQLKSGFNIRDDVRSILPVNSTGSTHLFFGINNSRLISYRLKK